MSFLSCMSTKTVPLVVSSTEALHENCVAVFNCRLAKETGRPWVSDVTFLPQGNIALLDKWNEKIKILDNQFYCKRSFSFKDADAFSVVSDDVIAIMASNTILLYSISGKTLSDVTIKETKFGGKGLALIPHDEYLVFLSENREVYRRQSKIKRDSVLVPFSGFNSGYTKMCHFHKIQEVFLE